MPIPGTHPTQKLNKAVADWFMVGFVYRTSSGREQAHNKFEYTKWVIRRRKSKDQQYSGQQKKEKTMI